MSASAQRVVVVALSGGVDSAVAAYRLRELGYRVVGAFMRPWWPGDDVDASGSRECTASDDYIMAQRVAEHLRLEDLRLIDLTREYWQSVFVPHILEAYTRGETPSPDLVCNRRIKFGAFRRAVDGLGDYVATGHHARLVHGHLCRAHDDLKDQTYFLAATPAAAFHRVLFPVGDMPGKEAVRALARRIGLPNAERRSTRGICFIGKRKSIASFLNDYVPAGGDYAAVDVDTGRRVGQLSPYWTVGQRARLSGMSRPYYVCDKDPIARLMHVCAGREHPQLWCRGYEVEAFDLWSSRHDAERACGIADASNDRYWYRAWHRHRLTPCTVTCIGAPEAAVRPRLRIRSVGPAPATAPGQAIVLYRQHVCVGGGTVVKMVRDE